MNLNRVVYMVGLGLALLVTGDAKLMVCYYTNWAQDRPQPMNFLPADIDVSLCTHFIYSFANLVDNQLAPYRMDDEDQGGQPGMYKRFNNMVHYGSETRGQQDHTGKLTLLAVGGWDFGTENMTIMLNSTENMEEFVNTSITYLRERGFDGLDLDFEYPAHRGSPPEDKERFTELCQRLRLAYEEEARETGNKRLLLTAAVPAPKSIIDQGYEVEKIAKELDFINIMSYDMAGTWNNFTAHHSPLESNPEDGANGTLNVRWTMEYWHDQGAPKEKLVVGLGMYGRCFQLLNEDDHGMAAPSYGGCDAGSFTQASGFLAYYEICKTFPAETVRYDSSQNVPYAHKGDQWIGYDNPRSLREKVHALSDYGGFMIWDLDLDDFNGEQCGEGKYPLLTAINQAMAGDSNGSPGMTWGGGLFSLALLLLLHSQI